MEVPADLLVTRKGLGEREMYLILKCLFEVSDEGRHLSTMSKGDLFGKVAFFSHSGLHSAKVRAITEGRLLVVRAKSLGVMIDKDPATAARLLLVIGSIMADRLANQT